MYNLHSDGDIGFHKRLWDAEVVDGELKLRQYRCPACQGTDFRIVSGREYFVDSIEAE